MRWKLGDTDETVMVAIAAVALTVAASILLHGLTAGSGGRRYVQRERRPADRPSSPPRARAVTLDRR